MEDIKGIKAGDIIEVEGAMFHDFRVGDRVRVHEDDRGLYVLGFRDIRLRLHEVFGFTKELTGEVYAMCYGFTFIKKG